MKTLCCSTTCEKISECKTHYINNEGNHYIEDWSSFGTCTYTDNGSEVEHLCGKFVNWKMFEPIV